MAPDPGLKGTMTTFHNPTVGVQRFDIAGVRYVVPPSADVDIPDRVAYVVTMRHMVLVPGPSPRSSVTRSTATRIPPKVSAARPGRGANRVSRAEEEVDEPEEPEEASGEAHDAAASLASVVTRAGRKPRSPAE